MCDVGLVSLNIYLFLINDCLIGTFISLKRKIEFKMFIDKVNRYYNVCFYQILFDVGI